MKYHFVRLAFASLLVGIAAGGLSATAPSDEGVPLDIDVRSAVDQRWDGFRKGGAIAHGKVYALVSVKDVSGGEKLIKPVDEASLVRQVRQELGKNGFREIIGQEKPEIILTITYGRGYLHNPYLDGAQVDDLNPGLTTATIVSPKQMMRQRGFDGEAKLQKAGFEKLYIAITAWRYPEAPGEKPYQFWRTVMATDNPDSRDLNLAMPAMLAAGAGWFDREIKEAEVTVRTTMPAGTVKLGPLEVIEEKTGK